MKSRAYIRVAILFVATVVIAFWGLNYLKGKNLLSAERSFYSVYDRIGGLARSSPVTINGFQIGQVRKIELSNRNPAQIEVRFSISYPSIKIPKGSLARIYSIDLMGTKGIALDLSTEKELVSSGDTLPGTIEGDLRDQVNAQMLPLKIKAESLMSSMDSVLMGIQLVFNQDNRENLAQSFSSISSTLDNLESASRFLNDYVKLEAGKISSVLSRADSLSLGLVEETGSVRAFIGNMRRFSDTLAAAPLMETLTALQTVLADLQKVTSRISAGEGSLGKLIDSDSIYSALLATNGSLNRLIEDIRLHPGRYVNVSLTDRSKSVYPLTDTELARELSGLASSDFYLCLFSSPVPLGPQDDQLQGIRQRDFIQVGGSYYYFVHQGSRLETLMRKLEKVRKEYPGAGIYTWTGGNWKRLSL